jgi:hypothetical protein
LLEEKKISKDYNKILANRLVSKQSKGDNEIIVLQNLPKKLIQQQKHIFFILLQMMKLLFSSLFIL